ncbi:hypothetical protein F503_06738 [Ophiostoma piceae UAMH 11346]|uniref:Uncharacterized protein n=1 Tax=Ophiostoma piceae (strain UAMH 11346) TaxID=1262450 RepID=S3CSC3_OPHP1|nr:hypothetical protein F503_06738 [Ophiostoma piceae UAMH 11346]
MAHVGLDDVNVRQQRTHVPAAVETLAQRNRQRRERLELFDARRVLRQQRLLDEDGPALERLAVAAKLERPRELLGHGLVQAPVEVDAAVEAGPAHRPHAVHAPADDVRGREIQPADILRRVHLDGAEPLRVPRPGLRLHVGGPVAADPRIDAQLVAQLAAEQLVDGHAELAGLEVPERNVDAGQRGHHDGPAAVEAGAPRQLPDVLDVVGVEALVAREPGVEAALDGLRVALERGLAPADVAVLPLVHTGADLLVGRLAEYVDAKTNGEVVARVRVEGGDARHLVGGQLKDLQVALDARRRHALGQHDGAALEGPADEHLRRLLAEPLRNVDDDVVVEGARQVVDVVAHGRVGLDDDAVALAPREQRGLLQERVRLDLVDCRLDLDARRQQGLELVLREVGHADGPHLAGAHKALHDLPGVGQGDVVVQVDLARRGVLGEQVVIAVVAKGDGPVDEIEVEVVGLEVGERGVELARGIGGAVVRVPELAGDEDLVARDAGRLDAGADFLLVLVDGGAVEVLVAVAEGDLDGICDLVRF